MWADTRRRQNETTKGEQTCVCFMSACWSVFCVYVCVCASVSLCLCLPVSLCLSSFLSPARHPTSFLGRRDRYTSTHSPCRPWRKLWSVYCSELAMARLYSIAQPPTHSPNRLITCDATTTGRRTPPSRTTLRSWQHAGHAALFSQQAPPPPLQRDTFVISFRIISSLLVAELHTS